MLQGVQESHLRERKGVKSGNEYGDDRGCQVLRRAMPAAILLPAPFRTMGGKRALAPLLPAAVRRALFDSIRARSDDAAVDAADSDEPEVRRGGAGSTEASSANRRFLLAASPARSARARAHSSRASAAASASSARSSASSAGSPYFSLRLLSASTRACSTFFSTRKRLRTRCECA